eukprot:TRINITY_DN26017_c0_g3_i3.p1 TRINITY_DN26017_c0_g3~~TRINITY_DN26017_c0_g3_i3.p1  ORF type:complete len:276 (-),score=55.41 TRINITY_DN26017_c0_g3_i3:214-1041(-)
MEYCPEGDLKEKIETDFDSFTEEWVRNIFAQLLQAVQYLHSKNVIHRDLKSQNVFLAQDGHVRLGDFGLCKHARTQRADGTATLSHAGTDCYMAPEMLSSSKYGKPADMWSLGCVLYELCTGVFMWELDGMLGAMVMKDPNAIVKLVKENVVPTVGSAVVALMRRLLSIQPTARPTATTCMRKRLFKRGFPLSRQTFGESLGDANGDGDELGRTPSTDASCAPLALYSGSSQEAESNKEEEESGEQPWEVVQKCKGKTKTPKKKTRGDKRCFGRS